MPRQQNIDYLLYNLKQLASPAGEIFTDSERINQFIKFINIIEIPNMTPTDNKSDIKSQIQQIIFSFEDSLLDCGMEVGDVDYDKLSIVRENALKLIGDFIDTAKKEERIEVIEEIKKIADSVPPNLLLNEIVNNI